MSVFFIKIGLVAVGAEQVNLLNCGYIQAYDRGGDIILTEKGRSVETGLYPTENDLQIQREYWDKKNKERYLVMNTGS